MNERNSSVIVQNTFIGHTPFHIVIDDTISEIQKNAFRHCYDLRIITIPPNVNNIDENAFDDCGALALPYSKDKESCCRILIIRCRQYSPAYYWVDNKKCGFIRVLY